MMNFCHCTVASQDIHVRQSIGPDGREIIEWTPPAEYLHRKHIRFQHINLTIRVPKPQDQESFLEAIIGVLARERGNYKTMDISGDHFFTTARRDKLLWATRALHLRDTGVEYEKMPHWDRNSTPLLYKDIVIDSPRQIYVQNVPVEGIITMAKYFLNEEMPSICQHEYGYDPDVHETLRESLKELKRWAQLEKGLDVVVESWDLDDEEYLHEVEDLDEDVNCITILFFDERLMRTVLVCESTVTLDKWECR